MFASSPMLLFECLFVVSNGYVNKKFNNSPCAAIVCVWVAILCSLTVCSMYAFSTGGAKEPNIDDLILKLYFTHGDSFNVSRRTTALWGLK